jgi:hypothetical protein
MRLKVSLLLILALTALGAASLIAPAAYAGDDGATDGSGTGGGSGTTDGGSGTGGGSGSSGK